MNPFTSHTKNLNSLKVLTISIRFNVHIKRTLQAASYPLVIFSNSVFSKILTIASVEKPTGDSHRKQKYYRAIKL